MSMPPSGGLSGNHTAPVNLGDSDSRVQECENQIRDLQALTHNMAQLEMKLAAHEGMSSDLVDKIKLQEEQLEKTHLLASQGQRGVGDYMIGDPVVWKGPTLQKKEDDAAATDENKINEE